MQYLQQKYRKLEYFLAAFTVSAQATLYSDLKKSPHMLKVHKLHITVLNLSVCVVQYNKEYSSLFFPFSDTL